MLTKLIKYEFRATARIMIPLYLLLAATALGGRLFARRLGDLGELLEAAFILILMAVLAMSIFLMIYRFQRNLLGDEGYLMFTLPVSVHQHLWSKLIVAEVWFAASLLLASLTQLWMSPEGFRYLIRVGQRQTIDGQQLLGELAALLLVGGGVFCLQAFASLAAGHSLSNHKNLWSVGFFLLLSSLASAAVEILDFDLELNELGPAGVHLALWLIIAGTAAAGAVYYLIAAYCLKNRLNLE